MRVFIYGAGAVGLGLASCLLKSKAEVCLLARPDTICEMKQRGMTRTGILNNGDTAAVFSQRSEDLGIVKNEAGFPALFFSIKSRTFLAANHEL